MGLVVVLRAPPPYRPRGWVLVLVALAAALLTLAVRL
jgi:hypothetical protein